MPTRKKKYAQSESESESTRSYSDSESSRSRSQSPSPSDSSAPSRSPSPKKKKKTAYMFFCEKERKVVKKEHPKWGFADISKELGKRWKKLGDRQRRRYQQKALEHNS